ncbi:hypothetical protein [Streptomyces lunaelactis]|uniref:hypothetical protein n=1 Tax=Streptomyces lunaelactis TaxID=1535768 RepID=UPI0015853DC1|nr:hypothetical protein [Streptomyces lunaelactis]NUL14484.1 hypothetical protein [Streptomyces lunaelactis]
MNRKSIDEITSDELDALYERLDKHSRALDRAHALTEQWAGDMTPVTRSGAADLFASLIELNGWEQTDARPHLAAVPPAAKESA